MEQKKNKKLKKINLYLFIITIILIFIIITNNYLILKYDLLPIKYLIIYFLLVDIIPIILIVLLLKKKKKGLKIFISIIEIIYIIILSVTFIYLNKTFNFLDNFTTGFEYQTKRFYVVVLKESKYKEIEDLNNKNIGYVNQINTDINKAINNLNNEIDSNLTKCEDYDELFAELENNKLSGILIGDVYYDNYFEDSNLKNNFKIIYTISLKEKTEKIVKETDVLNNTFNIYISGIDSYGNVNSLTRSDVNIVVSINPKSNQILMINIPRDYYVEFAGTEQKDKLTHAGVYGIDMSVKTIEKLLDQEINYYFKVNYAALEKLVNALGGVNVYSKYNFTTVGTDKNYVFKKGYNYVNGNQALCFVRTRRAFNDGDRVRGENQQAMIQAIIKKATSGAILKNYTEILQALENTFATNFSTDKITDLIKMQLDKMPSWNITSVSLNGTDGYDYTYTYPNQKLYVMIPDSATIESVKEKLARVKEGENLENSYQDNSTVVNDVTEIIQNKKNDLKDKTTDVTINDNKEKDNEKENKNDNSKNDQKLDDVKKDDEKDNIIDNEENSKNDDLKEDNQKDNLLDNENKDKEINKDNSSDPESPENDENNQDLTN